MEDRLHQTPQVLLAIKAVVQVRLAAATTPETPGTPGTPDTNLICQFTI